ncbi:MAG: phosphatidate cytidylyltransferase [Terricaulis sp.]|nr:phosphatidate cytidylyltransferase [Terricaulis sp.]
MRIEGNLLTCWSHGCGIDVHLPLMLGFAGVLALLLLGTLAALILPRAQPGKWSDLGPRMRSWWVIALLVGGALLAGWQAFTILMAVISFLALKEFLTLAPTRKEDRLIVLLAYLTIIVNYGLIFTDTLFQDSYNIYLVFTPVYAFLVMAATMAWIGRTDGFLSTVGIVHWGVVVCVYNIGYIAFLMRTPDAEAPAGAAGLVFFLLLITQLNDVAQYCWGKAIGRNKITPNVSPNKTWEGDRRLADDGRRVLFPRALLHPAFAGARGDHGAYRAAGRIFWRHYDERDQTRSWREGYIAPHPRPWRGARSAR